MLEKFDCQFQSYKSSSGYGSESNFSSVGGSQYGSFDHDKLWHQKLSSQQQIDDNTLLAVMNCLMHNKDCEIADCPCRVIQERYKYFLSSSTPPFLLSSSLGSRKQKMHLTTITESHLHDARGLINYGIWHPFLRYQARLQREMLKSQCCWGKSLFHLIICQFFVWIIVHYCWEHPPLLQRLKSQCCWGHSILHLIIHQFFVWMIVHWINREHPPPPTPNLHTTPPPPLIKGNGAATGNIMADSSDIEEGIDRDL